MSEIYGWLTPRGKFEECTRWGHFEAPSVLALWESEGYDERLADVEAGCQSDANAGEHPAWHCYDMAQSDFRSDLISQLYGLGFIRVGTNGMDIHFEYGSGCLVDGKLKACVFVACNALAKAKGCLPIFEDVH